MKFFFSSTIIFLINFPFALHELFNNDSWHSFKIFFAPLNLEFLKVDQEKFFKLATAKKSYRASRSRITIFLLILFDMSPSLRTHNFKIMCIWERNYKFFMCITLEGISRSRWNICWIIALFSSLFSRASFSLSLTFMMTNTVHIFSVTESDIEESFFIFHKHDFCRLEIYEPPFAVSSG